MASPLSTMEVKMKNRTKTQTKAIQTCLDDLVKTAIVVGVVENWAQNLFLETPEQDYVKLKKALTNLTGYEQVDHIVQFSLKYDLDLFYILFDGDRRKQKSIIEKDLASCIKVTCKKKAMVMFEAWLKELHDCDINLIKI